MADFAKLTGVSYHDIYRELKGAVEELLKKPIHIETEDGWIKTNWISGAEYIDGKGTISFFIYPKLRPYLLAVKRKFLQYKLENILRLRSGYSIRLYEILKDWLTTCSRYSKKAEKIVTVNELREMLEVPKAYRYNDFKRQILNKAQNDLRENTDISFDFLEIKTGRKITHLKFIIRFDVLASRSREGREESEILEKELAINDEFKRIILLLPEEKKNSKKVLGVILGGLRNYSAEYVEAQVKYVVNVSSTKRISSFSSYLQKALKDDYAEFGRISDGSYKNYRLDMVKEEYVGMRFIDTYGYVVSVEDIRYYKSKTVVVVKVNDGRIVKEAFKSIDDAVCWLENQKNFLI